MFYITQQAYGFHPCVFRAPIPLTEESPPAPPRPIRGRGARGESFRSGQTPPSRRTGSARLVTTIYQVMILISRVVLAATSKVQRSSILEAAETPPHSSSGEHQGSRKQHTTRQPHHHDIRIQLAYETATTACCYTHCCTAVAHTWWLGCLVSGLVRRWVVGGVGGWGSFHTWVSAAAAADTSRYLPATLLCDS